ncbi:EAL and HDOD domain-containing protein [Sulfurimonas sp.]
MKHVYLGRQPVLNKNSEICAYEILYRDSQKTSKITGDRYASASVITSVLNKFGTRSLLGHKRAFVKIDEKFLLNDIIFSVPKEFFIFTLLEKVEMNERVIERISDLHKSGYLLAVNDINLTKKSFQKYRPILKELSYVKVDFSHKIDDSFRGALENFRQTGVKLVATKIEHAPEYEEAKKLGFECFQGYFFAEPQILENAKHEPAQLNVLKLYNLLMVDTNIDEITSEFERNQEITLQLLQFINSGAFHFKKKISSIHHILTLLGRITVAKWLMLMIYAKSVSKSSTQDPLMLMVKNRTELMERIVKEIHPDAGSNMIGEAYFVGVLSLMDVVFNMRLEDLLQRINISGFVKNALLKNEGELGDIFLLVKAVEAFDVEKIIKFEKKYKLAAGSIKNIVVVSIENVNSFENVEAKAS